MDTTSYFIKNKALFGSFPSQDTVEKLENIGVRYFVDLTFNGEKYIEKYSTKYTYIHYPITDRHVPTDWKSYSQFIILLSRIITHLKRLREGDEEDHEKIYIHCRGGHGRSGVVVASLLCYLKNYTPDEALDKTSKYHNNRRVMRDKWRKIGSPQTSSQKYFIRRFFEPIHFYRAYKSGYTYGMSNFSLHTVTTELGTFPTAEAAFQAYKCPTNAEYVSKQLSAKTPFYSKQLGKKCQLRNDWYEVRDRIMLKVLRAKYEQHEDIRDSLLHTGLRPLVKRSNTDKYWGCGHDMTGINKMGVLLMKVRYDLYISEHINVK